MHESEYYDSIGEWLIQAKGCQRNKYSKGYVTDVKFSEKTRIDVFGLKCTFYDDCDSYNSFNFSGYAVEVKKTPSDAVNDIEKITNRYLPEMREVTPKRLRNCLHTINFYIAFNGDSTPPDILTKCRGVGVGILRLQESSEGKILLKEELEPVEHSVQGVSNTGQRNPGYFENAIRDTTYVNRVIEDPSKLFDECLRPKLVAVARRRALKHAIAYCTADKGKEALNELFSQVITNNPRLIAEGRGKQDHEDIIVISRDSGEQVLRMEMKLNYFYIDTLDGKRYRIVSKNEVLGPFDESGTPYTIDLPTLVETEIEPRLKT